MGTNAQPEQVDGTHYQDPTQHWDWAQHLPYLEGCATKYFGRHHRKNGLVDIRKGLTFVDKICQKYYGRKLVWSLPLLVGDKGPTDKPECDYNVSV